MDSWPDDPAPDDLARGDPAPGDPATAGQDGQDGQDGREPLGTACDEATLPAGIRLADEARPGRRCFVLIEGAATVEAAGNRLGELGAGAFVGSVDEAGRPCPASGLTVQLATRARVLVIDPGRLTALIDTDPAAAAAWRRLSRAQQAGGVAGL